MSKFKDAIITVVKSIPEGSVVSYGQVALYVGMPRGARQVGWILNGMDGSKDIPWWRVVNNQGRISIKGSVHSAMEQKSLLENEGLVINDDLTFDIGEYRFRPSVGFLESLKIDSVYLSLIADKIPFSDPKA